MVINGYKWSYNSINGVIIDFQLVKGHHCTVEARIIPVIIDVGSTKKTPFIECVLSHRNNQLMIDYN